MEKLTVVIPVRNEHATIKDNLLTIAGTLAANAIQPDFIVVDDGSEDNTWFELRGLAEKYGSIFGIRLSKSFGRDAAILAGLEQTITPLCLVMRSDLTHPPRIVGEMFETMVRSGADVVEAVADNGRGFDGPQGFLAGALRWIIKAARGRDPLEGSEFRLMSRKVVLSLRRFEEQGPSFLGIMDSSGFEVIRHAYRQDEPEEGLNAGPSLGNLAHAAARAVKSRLGKPPLMSNIFALLCLLGALAGGINALVASAGGEYGLSCLISVILAVGGLILAALGVIGAYITRVCDETKRWPMYVISDKTGGMFNKP